MEFDLVLRNGTVVTGSDVFDADIGICDGIIKQIGFGLGAAREEIDVAGHYLLPGAVDAHTHVDAEFQGVQSKEDFYTGTVAAACGGVTTILDYAIPAPGALGLTPLALIAIARRRRDA